MFRQRIKEVRKALKLSQLKFGEGIGVSDSAVNQWEKGTRRPDGSARMAICSVYHVNREWLETGKGPMFVLESQPVSPGDPEINEIIAIFENIDSVHREKILVFARDMRDYFKLIDKQLPTQGKKTLRKKVNG